MSVRLKGIPAAPGIAVSRVWVYTPPPTDQQTDRLSDGSPGVPGATAATIVGAAEEAARQLMALADRVRAVGRNEDAEIFEAQAMLATDPTLIDDAAARVDQGEQAAPAVMAAAEAAAAVLASLEDELIAARAADVRDVGARIVRILRGETLVLPEEPSIAVAADLPPSVTAEIPAGLLTGIVLEAGSPTAHAVILARSLGIPAIVGAAGVIAALPEAAGPGPGRGESAAHPYLGMDGSSGEVIVDPSAEDRTAFESDAVQLADRRRRAAASRSRPGATADGQPIALLANIGVPTDAGRALEAGAEGVGLFRTEFLFMRRATPPTEAEQVAAYRSVLQAFGGSRPVVIRLADIGGDKAIPYLDLAPEANPFLGVRAIRLAYADTTLLRTQLRAILRAGAEAGVTPHVMAPMVATLADVDLFRRLCDEAGEGLAADGVPAAERLVAGIMIEIPAAALCAAQLAREVDFFSIGTNDLTQYTMAADRGNATLASLHDALHPAVLRLIASTVAGADASGIPVAVCGELAGDPAGALVLAGLGVDELSADAGSLDEVRLALAACTTAELHDLAARCLEMPDAASVRAAATAMLDGAAR